MQSRPRVHEAMLLGPDGAPARIHQEVDHDYPTNARFVGHSLPFKSCDWPKQRSEQEWQSQERTMSRYVWISDSRSDSTLIAMVETDIAEQRFELGIKATTMMLMGEIVPPEMLPKVAWCDRAGTNKFPDFFSANGYWIVSRRAADIISRFDLGEGGLYPVEIFRKDRKTPVDGEYLCLNVGAQKLAFLPEQSPRVANRIPNYSWGLPDREIDNALHVSTAALVGPDLWYDPHVYNGFFMSALLGDALKKAGMAKAFRLYRCPVVEG